MLVIADENIPYVENAFASFGEVRTMPAREITSGVVRDATILLVRSVTRVNEALLSGSSVRYVATATIGVDHIDRDYLAANGIAFASAPGSNATSVSEWVAAALLHCARARGVRLEGSTLGIIGVGNVGSRVETKARALGMTVLRNDPPRARAEGDDGFVDLDTCLAESDVVTVHVPLTVDGPDKTLALADASFFQRMKMGSVFLNSSRGKVVDEAALRAALDAETLVEAVLDVWQNEPDIDMQTLARVALGTPHIAGYSFDGKVAGTRMIQDAAREALGCGDAWDPAPLLPEAEVPVAAITCHGRPEEEVLNTLVRAVYPITEDDRQLRKTLGMAADAIGPHFTRLRKEYPRRREFTHTHAVLSGASADLVKKAAGLGFRVD